LALTLQRKLEFAGDLAKVQPLLQRLHLVEKPKPKPRFGVRNVILVSSVIGAIGALTAVAVLWRRGRLDGAVANDSDGLSDDLDADFPIADALPVEDATSTTA
jgi:hypothetical protein